jgi:hypothetical protein
MDARTNDRRTPKKKKAEGLGLSGWRQGEALTVAWLPWPVIPCTHDTPPSLFLTLFAAQALFPSSLYLVYVR